MKRAIISSAVEARDKFAAARVTHVVSFRDEGFEHPQLDGVVLPTNWLRFNIKDHYWEPGTSGWGLAENVVNRLIQFAMGLPDDAVVGFNCRAGISRSTAAALITYVVQHGPKMGPELFWGSLERLASPNMTFVAIADERLGCDGSLVEFCEGLADRFQNQRGILVPTYLLRAANKTAETFIQDDFARTGGVEGDLSRDEIDALLDEFGFDQKG